MFALAAHMCLVAGGASKRQRSCPQGISHRSGREPGASPDPPTIAEKDLKSKNRFVVSQERVLKHVSTSMRAEVLGAQLNRMKALFESQCADRFRSHACRATIR